MVLGRGKEREGRDIFWKLLTCTLDSTRHFQTHVVLTNGSVDHIGDGIWSPRTQNPHKVLTLENIRFGERMWWIFEIYVYGFEWSNYLPTAGDDIFECCSLMCRHIIFIATAIVIVSFTLPNRFWSFNVRGNGVVWWILDLPLWLSLGKLFFFVVEQETGYLERDRLSILVERICFEGTYI